MEFKDINTLSFEEALEEFDTIIKKMEDGSIKLEDSISYYERGTLLKNFCEKVLKDAKLKIEKIQIQPIGNEINIKTEEINF